MEIKQITQYVAIDGKVFTTQKECEDYEKTANVVYAFLDTIPDPKKFNISNGYIQHRSGVKKQMERLLVELSNQWFTKNPQWTNFNYELGRYIDDSNMKVLNHLMFRYICTDYNEREYEQPYFANHPNEAPTVQLNK